MMHKPVGVDIFYSFLGAIAQLINPNQAVKFVMDILKKTQQPSNSKDTCKKMQKLYKFRKMQELEKHVGTTFKNQTILVQSLTDESYTQSHLKQ